MVKHTRITIETVSFLLLKGRSHLRAWCPQCAVEVELATSPEIGPIAALAPLGWEEWFGSEKLHRVTVGGSSLLCLPSLCAHLETIQQPGDALVAEHNKEKQ